MPPPISAPTGSHRGSMPVGRPLLGKPLVSSPVSPAEPAASLIALLPKAELHLHMEGAIEPPTAVALAARYGDTISEPEVTARYATRDFAAFIEAYKWVTSYLRAPADYALVATAMANRLLAQNVAYAEVTLSAGVMLLRKQDVAANFRAIREAAAPFERRGLRLQWIFDAVRQFGPAPALDVVRRAAELRGDTELWLLASAATNSLFRHRSSAASTTSPPQVVCTA